MGAPNFFSFACALAAGVALSSSAARAEAPPPADRYFLAVHGETHAALFRRALLPGTSGAVIADETMLPVHQYVQLAARDLNDAPKHTRIDLQLAAWWRGELASTSS